MTGVWIYLVAAAWALESWHLEREGQGLELCASLGLTWAYLGGGVHVGIVRSHGVGNVRPIAIR
jgi:hypothetical protein